MELDPAVRYQQAFEHWRLASNIRFKILGAWWAVYIGLAVVFKWAWIDVPILRPFAYFILVAGGVAGLLFWLMDELNGGAIHAAKLIVQSLEDDAGIPERLQMVKASRKRWVPSHTCVIRAFALVTVAPLLFAAGYFRCLGS